MSIASILCVLILSSPAMAGKAIHFKHAPLTSGQVVRQQSELTLDISANVSAGEAFSMEMQMTNREMERTRYLLTRVVDGLPVQFDMHLVERVSEEGLKGNSERTEHPLHNYQVTVDHTCRQQGDCPPSFSPTPDINWVPTLTQIADELTDLHLDFSTIDHVQKKGAHRVLLGQRIDINDMVDLTGNLNDLSLTNASVELTGSRPCDASQCAVFTLTFELGGTEPTSGLQMAVACTGELLVDRQTSIIHGVELTGPLTMVGQVDMQGVSVDFNGTGTLRLSTQTTVQ